MRGHICTLRELLQSARVSKPFRLNKARANTRTPRSFPRESTINSRRSGIHSNPAYPFFAVLWM
jgi:hypothetical protein